MKLWLTSTSTKYWPGASLYLAEVEGGQYLVEVEGGQYLIEVAVGPYLVEVEVSQ
jgi:hypothetical protein